MSEPCTCGHTHEQHEALFHVDEAGACSPHGHRCHGYREGSFRTPCDCTSYWTGAAAPAPEAPPPAEPAGPYRTPAPPPAPVDWGQKIWCVCSHVAGDHLSDELAIGSRSCQAEGCTCDCFSTKREGPTCGCCAHPMADHPTATSCSRDGCTCGRYEDENEYADALQQLARDLVDSLPKCGCGGLATVEMLVPFEYTYTACLHCAGRRLAHGTERAKPLPHAAQAALVLQLLPGGAAVWAELTRTRTEEERRAAHDRRFPPEET